MILKGIPSANGGRKTVSGYNATLAQTSAMTNHSDSDYALKTAGKLTEKPVNRGSW